MSFRKSSTARVRSHLSPVEAKREWFASLLRKAFPASSDHARSKDAAPVLGVSDRQVRNWLNCEHDASFVVVMKVVSIAGGEVLFRALEPRR